MADVSGFESSHPPVNSSLTSGDEKSKAPKFGRCEVTAWGGRAKSVVEGAGGGCRTVEGKSRADRSFSVRRPRSKLYSSHCQLVGRWRKSRSIGIESRSARGDGLDSRATTGDSW